MNFYNKWALFGSRDANRNFHCQQKTLYDNYISGNDSEVINVKWAKGKYLPLAGGTMSGDLNMSNNKINNIVRSTNNFGVIYKQYVDDNFVKLSGGTMTGVLNLRQSPTISIIQALNYHAARRFFVGINNPYVYKRFDMVNNKIINLADPTDDKDAVNKQFLEQSHIKQSHSDNQFAYLMANNLEWSDVTSGGNSFNMTKIADLPPEQGDIHSCNHKVIYTTMIKTSQGG